MARLLAPVLVGFLPLAVVALVHCDDGAKAALGSPDAAVHADGDVTEVDVPLVPATKVDLLFVIDNSASMRDKAAILASSVATILRRFADPRCVSAVDRQVVLGPSSGGVCPAGVLDHAPIDDIHVGVITSSLGNFGGDICDPTNARTNDRGHLWNGGFQVVPGAERGFLAYRRGSAEGSVADLPMLETRTTELLRSVSETGCGVEAQLESMYRFLVQPDPFDAVSLDAYNQADFGNGIDLDVLQQRADFLRPDSLVAIVMLTDEDDGTVDPLSSAGTGWVFMSKRFPGSNVSRSNPKQGTTAPRSTTACASDPRSVDCTSCGFQSSCDPSQPSCQKIKEDPNCTTSGEDGQTGEGYSGYYRATDDEMNIRFQHMKQRYGIDPQYPIERYVRGLSQRRVPNRATEHASIIDASGRRRIAPYEGTPKCTNPLFAASLPRAPGDELCALPEGSRSRQLVLFELIGGVPNELITPTPNWTAILGRDPAAFDETGIDPHMIQSVAPRAGLSGADLPRGDNGTDPIHGREWQTQQADLQYACTFDLPVPRACSPYESSCDCVPGSTMNPPLCASSGNQIKAKAYPTIRELRVAKELGDRAVVGSICAQDPSKGYATALDMLADRARPALASTP